PYNQQQVERVLRIVGEKVILVTDIRYQLVVLVLQFVPVPAIEHFIGDSEERRGKPVLKVEDIRSGETQHGALVVVVIPHYLFITFDPFYGYLGENPESKGT